MTSDISWSTTGLVTVYLSNSNSAYNEDQFELLKENIRKMIDYDKTFNNIEICHEFIRSIQYERIFLISTPEFVEHIFKQNIPDIRHVQSIFIFDPLETISNIDYLKCSSYKVQDVFMSSKDLLQCLWQCVMKCANKSDILLSSLASCSADTTTNVVNNIADYSEFWYPLYVDFLLSDSVMSDDKTNFIHQCRLYFSRSLGTLKLIDDFEKNYTSTSALSYYSRDGFVYRCVNRALRQQILDSILDIRFLLRDIHTQLQSAYKLFDSLYLTDDWLTFYRGQSMSHIELEKLKKKYRDGTLITTNSYLSSSLSRKIALIFAGKSTADTIPVLFEIQAQFKDPNTPRSKPFAYMGGFSKYGNDELEVLFSVGSFFKIDQIDHDYSVSLCTIKMTFIDDDDEMNYIVTDDFRTLRTCSYELKLIKIGNLLSYNLSEGPQHAATFYDIIQSRHFSPMFTAACYAGLGWLALREQNTALAIEWQEKALEFYKQLSDDIDNVTSLYMTSYNCIGAALRINRNYEQALDYYLMADELRGSKMPIDKHDMYDCYRNIASVNIASIYKYMGYVDRAWDKYKKILINQMKTSKRFHGHTFLTIAQAGLYEALMAHDKKEYQRCLQSWKAFLDYSLTDLSSSFRRSIVSGVLLIGFEYATNEQTQNVAIDYFKKIINISSKYINISKDDYYIVLRCYLEMARLHRKTKRTYFQAITQASIALQLCRSNDLESIADCYKNLVDTSEQQILDETSDLTPEDIGIKLCDPFFTLPKNDHTHSELAQRSTITFKQSEFAFGQYTTTLSPNITLEDDHKRRLAYYQLKLAALAQHRSDLEVMQAKKKKEEGKIDEAEEHYKIRDRHLQTARELLIKVSAIIPDSSVQNICTNNLAYLDGDFMSIISVYQEKINERQSGCIGENAFCYIAHLFGRMNNVEDEQRWYRRAIDHFQRYGHICKHTVTCFVQLAMFYERTLDFLSTTRIYNHLIKYLIDHRPPSFLHASIVPIVKPLIESFKDQIQWKTVINILKHLVELVLKEHDDDSGVEKEFRKIIEECKNIDQSIVVETYASYLEITLRHRVFSYHPYLSAIEEAYRQAILAYKVRNDTRTIIKIYQTFIELIINPKTDRSMIVAAYRPLALGLEAGHLIDAALDIYMRLGQFILIYGTKEDKLAAGFVIGRYRLLSKSGATFNPDCYRTIVQLMFYYRNAVEPQFVIDDYLKTMIANLKRNSSATSIYMDMLELYMKYRPEHYEKHFKATIDILNERPAELIAFVSTTRVDYVPLIEIVYKHLTQLSTVHKLECLKIELSSTFEEEAQQWLTQTDSVEDAIYYGKCLQCILEWHSIDDEYLASTYVRMGDKTRATAVFNKFIYGDPALLYNINACRRYLKYVYNDTLTIQERTDIEQCYAKHFILEGDSVSDNYSFEIFPIENLTIKNST